MLDVNKPILASLKGKFHIHFTVDGNAEDVLAVAKGSGMKATIIYLYGTKNAQTDPMLTRYYWLDEPGLGQLEGQIKEDLEKISSLGLKVIRAKLEHEGDEEGELDSVNYTEAHLKMVCKREEYKAMLAKVEPKMTEWGFVLSKNPLDVSVGKARHFANIRVKSGSVDDAKAHVQDVIEKIQGLGIEIEEAKVELNVWDTNQQRDLWWA